MSIHLNTEPEQLFQLLWIEPSMAIQKMAAQKLGVIPCQFVDNLSAAALALEKLLIDAVVVSQNLIEDSDFLNWVQSHFPELDILILGEPNEELLGPKSHVIGLKSFLQKPAYWLDMYVQPSLMKGELRQVNLFDLARLFCFSPQGKRICVYDPAEDIQGELYFENGKMVSASLGELIGDKALFQMMGLKKGFFAELLWQEPKHIDFHEPFDALMMKAAQYLDEFTVTEHEEALTSNHHLKILAIDHNPVIQQMYQAFFSRYEYHIHSALNSEQALMYLENQHFDVILLEIALSDERGKLLLQTIQQKAYPGKIIIVSDTDSEAVRRYCQSKGAVKYFLKPPSLKELYIFLRYLFKQRSFRGTLKYVSLIDLFQILLMDNQSHKLEFAIKGVRGYLHIKQGSLLSAEWADLKGVDAFFHILKLKSGSYRELTWSEPAEANITLSTGQLLLKAANLISPPLKAKTVDTHFGDRLRLLKDVREILQPLDENGMLGPLKLLESQLDTEISLEPAAMKLRDLLSIFEDLGIELKFNANGYLEQLGFLNHFEGQTQAGLKIGDSLDKASSLYGDPQYADHECAIWDQMAVFLEENCICRFYLGAL